MQKKPETYFAQLKKNRALRNIVRQLLPILSLVVILGVFWNLKLTGITMAGEAFCGKEEHSHDEKCTVLELSCILEESEEHTHTDACAVKTLTCGLEEQDVHTHTDRCTKQELTCTLEESEGHTHTDACAAKTVTCGLEEQEVHTHTDRCTKQELTCTLEELEGHTHTDACAAKTLTCGLEEQEVHTHTDGCTKQELICTLTEEKPHFHVDDTCVERTLECALGETEDHTHEERCYKETWVCVLEETEGHTHAGNCYKEAIACGMEEGGAHAHTDKCYTVDQTYGCGLEETAGHAHGGSCYKEAIACGMEEDEPHAHTDKCYTVDQTYGCGLEETAGHAHEGSCYIEAVACGMEEDEPHVHTDKCYTIDETYGCGLEETAGHTHADACYEIPAPCLLEEHIHIETCYSDISADVETAAVWEQTLSGLDAAAAAPERITAAARSQLGYRESTLNFQVDENGVRRGYTRYGEWYGHPYGDWSAMFVSFCLHYAGITEDMVPYNSGVEAMRLSWQEIGVYQTPDNIPQPGDVLFLDKDANGTADAAAVVTSWAEGTLNVIEGDLEDTVAETTYQTTDTAIMGYGSIRSILRRSLTEEDVSRIENVNTRIEALPTEEEVLEKMDSMDPDSEEFQSWYYALCQEVKTLNADYEALSADLRLLVPDTTKMDALAWTWQTAVLANDTVVSVDVYHINLSSDNDAIESLATIIYGGSAKEVMEEARSFAWWHAFVVEKENDGYYVRDINRYQANDEVKWDIKPDTTEGFVLMVQSDRDSLANVEVGDSVQISPNEFYKTDPKVSSVPLGKLTFTRPKNNSSKLSTTGSVSTRDLITLNLFNYGTNINDKWDKNKNYPGFQSPGEADLAKASRMDFGNSITAEIGAPSVLGGEGAINGHAGNINFPISGAIKSELVNGYPALADGTSLDYLFTNGTYAKQANSQNIDGLFRYDASTGKYHFNSRENHAQFDAGTSTFTLYQQIVTPNFIIYPFGNFLPFNDIQTEATQTTQIDRNWFAEVAASAQQKYYNGMGNAYLTLYNVLTQFDSVMGNSSWDYHDVVSKYFDSIPNLPAAPPRDDTRFSNLYTIDYDEPTDFFFGMSMHMDFMQPKDGMTGPDGDQPMEYTFAGDDDVWIYVDGKLFLDLSGMHRHVGGKIDFKNGMVSYYGLDPGTGDVESTAYKTVTFAEILGTTDDLNEKGVFEDYSSHTMDFFYMERGAGSGVCRMEFNLPLIKKNSITVTKELEADGETRTLGDPDFRFQVCREDGESLLVGPDVEYSILDQNGNIIDTGETDQNGVFTIKAGQSAYFGDILESEGKYFVRELLDPAAFSQYDQVTVDGVSYTINDYEDAAVGGIAYKGIDSSVKDMSDGSTSFLFRNRVDPEKFGSLKISKELQYYGEGDQDKEFTVLLNFDRAPVPGGTDYTLIAADGTEETETVDDPGQLTLKHGQTARFDNVLAGSEVYVTEDSTSAAAYVVTYTGQNITLTGENGGVTGMIPADATAHITVINAPDGPVLSVSGTKELLYPDGGDHTYTFELRQIVSREDTSYVEGGTHQRQTVTLNQGSADFLFHLVYPAGTTSGTYYYLIAEENAAAAGGMDTSRYIAEVTLTEADGGVTPALTALYKNESIAERLVFTNAIVRSLTVTKEVQNPISSEDSFRFDITASVGGTLLTGTYPCTAQDGSISDVTFDGGKATVYLQHGESITIGGLPYGTEWSVTEVGANGYFTSCGVEGSPLASGSTISGSLREDETVSFLNFGGAQLPATGSYARMIYIFGGWTIMILSLICGIGLRRRRERRNR